MLRFTGCVALAVVLGACSSQASETELLERARQAIDQGNVRAAVIDVKTALQQNPASPQGRRLLGEVYAFQQSPTAAAEEFLRSLEAAEDDEVQVLYAQALIAAGEGEKLLELDAANRFSAVAEAPGYLTALALAEAANGNAGTAKTTLDTAREAAPDDPYVATTHAFFLFRYAGDIAQARSTLRETLALHPDYAEAWSLLGDLELTSREFESAEKSYQKAVELNPYRLPNRLNLVAVKIQLGKMEKAAEDVSRLLASYPDHPEVNYANGRILLHSGDDRGALEAFTKVLGVWPTHPGSLYLAAIGNIREGNLDSALDQLNRFLIARPGDRSGRLQLSRLHLRMGNAEAAEVIARDILETDAMNFAAMELLANALTLQGRGHESPELYSQIETARRQSAASRFGLQNAALQQDAGPLVAGNQPRTSESNAAEIIQRARAAMLAGRFAEAEAHLRRAIELQPDNTDLRKMVSDALVGQGKLKEAGEMLAGLPEPVASEPGVLVAKGRIALAEKQPAAAEPYLRAAMDASPNNMTLLWLSGSVAAQDRREEAMQLLDDWLAKHPGDALVRVKLASAYLELGKEEEARAQYEKLVEAEPDNAVALNNLAWLTRTVDPQRALGYIEKANGIAPENPQIMDTHAMVQLQRGAHREALELNARALELSPDHPQLLYHRALILQGDGQADKAITILEGLVSKGDFAQLEEAESLLAELRGS